MLNIFVILPTCTSFTHPAASISHSRAHWLFRSLPKCCMFTHLRIDPNLATAVSYLRTGTQECMCEKLFSKSHTNIVISVSIFVCHISSLLLPLPLSSSCLIPDSHRHPSPRSRPAGHWKLSGRRISFPVYGPSRGHLFSCNGPDRKRQRSNKHAKNN